MPPLNLEKLNQLLRMVAEGNPEALDGIFALVGKRMFVLARGIVKNEADAEDVLSDSFLKIARGANSFKTDTNGYAFVMRVVRNTAFDLLRKRKVRAEEDLDAFFHLTDERYSPERREDAIALESAMEHLNREEKQLIYYRYYLDFTIRDIAKELGLSKSAVERKISAAEQKLLSIMAGQRR